MLPAESGALQGKGSQVGLELSHILVNVCQKQVKDVTFRTNLHQREGEEPSNAQCHLLRGPSCDAQSNTPGSCRTGPSSPWGRRADLGVRVPQARGFEVQRGDRCTTVWMNFVPLQL